MEFRQYIGRQWIFICEKYWYVSLLPGCCVYEMSTLKHAFTAKNIHALMIRVVKGEVCGLLFIFVYMYVRRYVCMCIVLYIRIRWHPLLCTVCMLV